MANIKSAKKRILTAAKRAERNKSKKTEMRTYIKKFEGLLADAKLDEAREMLKLVDKKLKRAADKNIIHKNAAARKLSRLQTKLNNIV